MFFYEMTPMPLALWFYSFLETTENTLNLKKQTKKLEYNTYYCIVNIQNEELKDSEHLKQTRLNFGEICMSISKY